MFYSADKSTMGWRATYTSEKVGINIYYERVSFETYLTLNLKKPNILLYIEEIIRGNDKRNYCCATTTDIIEKSIIEMATLLKRYGEKFLSGDTKAFEDILKARGETTKKYDLKLIEERAARAWENGRYSEVVTLYQSIKEDLTPIQEKRLSLSLKKINE
jgi:hypothetical protein